MIYNAERIDANIAKLIDDNSRKFYLIQRVPGIKCACVCEGTKQGNPKCPKCLGLGCKIRIREVKGAGFDIGVPSTSTVLRPENDNYIGFVYYIKANVTINNNDIIIDNNDIEAIYNFRILRGFKNIPICYKCFVVPKKDADASFMKNFNELIGR